MSVIKDLSRYARTSYELFGAEEEQIDDIEMLYRAMYHKIGNEIAVLRSISYRLLKEWKENTLSLKK